MSRLELHDAFLIEVEAQSPASGLCESDGKRDADIAKAKNGDFVL